MKYAQLLVLIVSTCILTQIVDCVFDEFFLLGISQLIQINKLKEEQLANKPVPKKHHFFSRIRNTFHAAKEHYLDLLPNIDNITGYGTAILCILAGIVMIIYFVSLLIKLWTLWLDKRSLVDIIINYKSYIYLLLTVLINFGIITLIFTFNENAQNTYEKVNLSLNDFEKNYVALTRNLKNDPNYSGILQSMTRIRMYFYINYIRVMCAILSLFFLCFLTFFYLITSICF